MRPKRQTQISLRGFVTGLGLFVAIVTAVSIPAGYLFVEYSSAANNLAFKAQLKANRVAKYIYSHGELWQYQAVRLVELIEVPEATVRSDQQRIVDDTNKVVVEVGATPASPAMHRTAPIVVRGITVGNVEVAVSARPLAIDTAIAALAGCLLGFAIYLVIRVFPLRVLNRAMDVLDRTQRDLELQNARFDTALNNMSQGLVMFDADQRIVVRNDRYLEMYDLSPDIVKPGCTLQALLQHRVEQNQIILDPERYRTELAAQLRLGKKFELIVETMDGRTIAILNQPMPNGGWVATHDDITERRRAEAKIAHMALHDALTNLPNRLFIREQLEAKLTRLPPDQKFAVLCLDLDRFKIVNDTLGHHFGDILLRQLAGRIAGCLREGDTLARLAGDEFAILESNIKRPSDAIALADRIFATTSAPFELEDHQVVVGVSIGIAIAPTDASEASHLLKNADMALYRAKADGRGTYRFFEPEMDALMQARRALEVDLRKALVNGEFEIHYQPIVGLENQAITGFEALVRWNRPGHGLVDPLQFIPLAEETGLIVPIGEWILRQACSDAAKWPGDISVAVNLSPAQFKMRNLSQTVISALAQSRMPASRLELEITESVLLVNNAATLETLHQLRNFGVRISMDDFGTGYSSLSYLRSFPFDKIKIDQSFVRNLATNSDSQAIVRAVTGLGNNLGMRTTGEGVETQDECDYLKLQGCTEAQGYFFGKPKPVSEVLKLLSQQRGAAKAVA